MNPRDLSFLAHERDTFVQERELQELLTSVLSNGPHFPSRIHSPSGQGTPTMHCIITKRDPADEGDSAPSQF